MTTVKYTVIQPDGTTEQLEALWPDGSDVGRYEVVCEVCDRFIDGNREHVRVFWNDRYTSMFVDEDGHEKGLPLNRKATEIYHNNTRVHDPKNYDPAKMPPIVGTAILFERDVWR